MLRKRRAAATVIAFVCAFAALYLPAIATAASQTFTVNGTGDSATEANCESASTADECTLRGAIEAADATSEADTIHFDPFEFDGATPGSTITLGEKLPTITEPVAIDAGECASPIYSVQGPCAQIDGSGFTTENVFTVGAGASSIKGIAVEGGKNGIVLSAGAEGFSVAHDWFGIRLDGFGGGASANAGILIEPGVEEATIGGETVAGRNVFEESNVGIEIRGASENQVQGNYIGLQPNGQFSFGRSVQIGVRIIDSTAPAGKAERNQIGGARAAAKSTECSGACNAIATEGAVSIAVESATGPTTISGNYVGLTPDGTGESTSRSHVGVLAVPSGTGKPGPGGLTVGGPTAATEGNLFVGGEYGVSAEGAKGLEVLGNKFGYTSAGEAIEDGRALDRAIFVSSEGLTDGATIASNSISAESAGGIESLFTGSQIVGNTIGGGAPAIFVGAPDGGVGNSIRGNTITEPAVTGIVVENEKNVLSGNVIAKSKRLGIALEGESFTEQSESNLVIGNTISEAAQVGIEVGSNANHNRIGGDGAGEANTVVKSGLATAPPEVKKNFGAISIFSRTTGRTEIAANLGSGNSGAFIKLISHGGPETPNGGILPPAFASVLQSSAAGTAEPNATVRIFGKTNAEPGELGALLAVVKADSVGHWTATYATVGVGALVTATQTDTELATSELATAVAAGADPVKPEEPKGGGSTQASPSSSPSPAPIAASAPTKPKVEITKGPKRSSEATKATFKFKAEPAAGASFECKLDARKWAKCRSPKTYKGLKPGKHTFRVRAKASGLTSAAAKYQFTVKP